MLTPIEAVVRPDPYPYYATLVAERPFYFDESLRSWVASGAAAVTAVLSHPGCRVRPEAEPVPRGIVEGPAGAVFRDLVRMTDGPTQQCRKRVVADTLAHADHKRAAALATDFTRESFGRPVAESMFAIPARVVAVLCGLDHVAAARAACLVGDFVLCIPATATPEQQGRAAEAAEELRAMLGPLLDGDHGGLLGGLVREATRQNVGDTAALLANGVGLLSQTYDATAGLIGNTLVALRREGLPTTGLEAFVREVIRHDAPVQNTRRFLAGPFRHADMEVTDGAQVLVVLAAANRDPAANSDPHAFRRGRKNPTVFTFGVGGHRCPGVTLAVTIATAVVRELLNHGFDPVKLPSDITYHPISNARIPELRGL